ncbi:MAG: hypothetical protein VX619_06865 [bacterium]|nr:hypothetical protein [bacterium]
MKNLKYGIKVATCILACISFGSFNSVNYAEVSQNAVNEMSAVEDMVEKLFLRLDVRHREILSIEENITHNRSSIEKESLSRILERKVRDFVKKDAMVAKALDRLKNSPEKENVFLYRKSMDRLDHYRKNIDQIQQLYFRKPVVVSPEINIETGNENFETFLSSWEARKPIHNKERKTKKAVIPNKEVEYFAHVKRQASDKSNSGSYVEFLDKLHPETPKPSHKTIAKTDKKAVDKFHDRLQKEKRSSIPKLQKDQSFSNFFDQLENTVTTAKKEIEIGKVREKTGGPFDVQKRYLKELDEPTPQVNPLTRLMSDLDRMTAQKRSSQRMKNSPENGRSFSKFFDQLDLSNSQKDSIQKGLKSTVDSDKEFDQFVAKAEKSITETPAKFSQLHLALTEPQKAGKEEVLNETKTIERPRHPVGKGKTSFMEAFASIPTENLGAAHKGKEKSSSNSENTNRFRVILNSLKKDNQKTLLEAEYVDGDEKIFEKELAAVFPDKIELRDAAKADIVKAEAVRFDKFPGNIHNELATDEMDMGHFGTRGATSEELNKRIDANEARRLAALSDNETPLSSNNSEGSAYSDGEGSKEVAAEINTSGNQTNEMGAAYDGKIHPRKMRLARQAEARLLRKNASLIPIIIETRDKKDRLYSELPIDFQVEMEPRNFITGHILNSYVDNPWQHTVKTNTDGIAAVHLLLDLKGKEVNISRTLETTMDRTICKVLITPKY